MLGYTKRRSNSLDSISSTMTIAPWPDPRLLVPDPDLDDVSSDGERRSGTSEESFGSRPADRACRRSTSPDVMPKYITVPPWTTEAGEEQPSARSQGGDGDDETDDNGEEMDATPSGAVAPLTHRHFMKTYDPARSPITTVNGTRTCDETHPIWQSILTVMEGRWDGHWTNVYGCWMDWVNMGKSMFNNSDSRSRTRSGVRICHPPCCIDSYRVSDGKETLSDSTTIQHTVQGRLHDDRLHPMDSQADFNHLKPGVSTMVTNTVVEKGEEVEYMVATLIGHAIATPKDATLKLKAAILKEAKLNEATEKVATLEDVQGAAQTSLAQATYHLTKAWMTGGTWLGLVTLNERFGRLVLLDSAVANSIPGYDHASTSGNQRFLIAVESTCSTCEHGTLTALLSRSLPELAFPHDLRYEADSLDAIEAIWRTMVTSLELAADMPHGAPLPPLPPCTSAFAAYACATAARSVPFAEGERGGAYMSAAIGRSHWVEDEDYIDLLLIYGPKKMAEIEGKSGEYRQRAPKVLQISPGIEPWRRHVAEESDGVAGAGGEDVEAKPFDPQGEVHVLLVPTGVMDKLIELRLWRHDST